MNTGTQHIHLFTKGNCLSEKALLEYIDNKLTLSERNTVEKHLLDCELCSDALEGLELVKNRKKLAETHSAISEKIDGTNRKGRIIKLDIRTQFAIAASLLLLLGAVWFFKNNINTDKVVADKLEKQKPVSPMEMPPPITEKTVENNPTKNEGIEKKETVKALNQQKKADKEPVANSSQPNADDNSVSRKEENEDAKAPVPAAIPVTNNVGADANETAKRSYPSLAKNKKSQNNEAAAPVSIVMQPATSEENEVVMDVTETYKTQEKVNKTEEKYGAVIEQAPEFPGGENELMRFLEKNIVYPPSALDASIAGTVYLTFVVEKNGILSTIKILKNITGCEDCSKEALRVIQLMPSWKAGKQNGKPVRVHYNLPVKFSVK